MVRLMIEEMREKQGRGIGAKPARIVDVLHSLFQKALVERVHELLYAGILAFARGAQAGEVSVKLGGKRRRGGDAGIAEMAHPETVAPQDVIQREVNVTERAGSLAAVVFIGQLRARLIEALVGHGVVPRHGLKVSRERRR